MKSIGTEDCYSRTEKEYTYKVGGRLLRMRSTVHDSTNQYATWAANYNDYFYYTHESVVAERHDDTGGQKILTRWGRELIGCTQGAETYFYIQNIRGDVVMLVNTNGIVKAIRDYDATGQMLCQAPRDRDPFGFTGGLDAGNGLWKLGARFYDSGKSAFIQQDRYMGDPSDPLSLNRYVYCGLDPVNYVDPTGYDWKQCAWSIIGGYSSMVGGAYMVAGGILAIGAVSFYTMGIGTALATVLVGELCVVGGSYFFVNGAKDLIAGVKGAISLMRGEKEVKIVLDKDSKVKDIYVDGKRLSEKEKKEFLEELAREQEKENEDDKKDKQ